MLRHRYRMTDSFGPSPVGSDSVVPVAMELVGFEEDPCHLLIGPRYVGSACLRMTPGERLPSWGSHMVLR